MRLAAISPLPKTPGRGHSRVVPKIAESLRKGREAKGWTVYQVAEMTKIRTEHIRALEEGNYNAFSATIFIKGFVRTYSSLLKLNVPEILAELESELAQTEKFREPPSLMGESHGWVDMVTLQLSKVNWRWVAPVFVLAILVAAGLLGYRAWRTRPVKEAPINLRSGIYEPAISLPAATLPLPTNSPATNPPVRLRPVGKGRN